MVLTMSKNMLLSERVLSGSFKPGVSIKVILPLLEIVTTDVTEVRDLDASNLIGVIDPLNCSL